MKFSNDQVQQLRGVVREEIQGQLKKELKPIKSDLKSIKKDLNWVIGKYDSRLNHLEKHTSHPPGRITDL